MANSTAIEQQDGHFDPKASIELRIGIDIDHRHGGYGLGPLERGQRMQHVFAQAAALAAQDHEASG